MLQPFQEWQKKLTQKKQNTVNHNPSVHLPYPHANYRDVSLGRDVGMTSLEDTDNVSSEQDVIQSDVTDSSTLESIEEDDVTAHDKIAGKQVDTSAPVDAKNNNENECSRL